MLEFFDMFMNDAMTFVFTVLTLFILAVGWLGIKNIK